MNARPSLLAALPALVALVIGLGAGYALSNLVSDGGDAGARGGAVAAPTGGSSGARAADGSDRGASRRKTDVTAAAPLAVRGDAEVVRDDSPRVSEAQFARARETVKAPEVAAVEGSGTITGTIKDENGEPVGGVTVLAWRNAYSGALSASDVGKAAPEDTSLDEALRSAAESWAESRASKRRARTGSDGRYVLTGLDAEATYRVTPYLEDVSFDAVGSSYQVSAGSTMDFDAERVYRLAVRLVHADGSMPADGVVSIQRGNSTSSYRWTRDEPNVRATAGRVVVRGFAGIDTTTDSHRGVVSAFASKDVDADAAEQGGEPLTLQLEPRTGIRGRVVGLDDGGNRPQVRVMPVPDAASVDLDALADADTDTWLSSDRFEVLDLAPGTYAVGLASWNEPVLVHEVVTLTAGLVDVVLRIPEPDPDQSLIVTALDPSGAPLRDPHFSWTHESGTGSRSGGINGRRDARGAWVLLPKADYFDAWPAGTSYELEVRAEQFGSRRIELAEGQREVEVRFEEPVSIELVVTNYAGSGYEGRLQATATRVTGDEDPGRHMFFGGRSSSDGFGADGVKRFERLEPGAWRVTLSLSTGQWQTRPIDSVDVTLQTGERTVRMEIPPLFDVAVHAPEMSEGAWMQLTPKKNGDSPRGFFGGSNDRLDADRRLVFQGVAAGEYRLSGSGIHAPIDVTVPCGEILVEAREPNAFRVAIGDLTGKLYTSGLRAGDVIVGADGKRFEGTSQATFLSQPGKDVDLIVVRDGREIAVTAPSGLYSFGADLGGSLQPISYP